MNSDIIADFLLVLIKILSLSFVMLLGWVMRRTSCLDDNATTRMSNVMLNFVFPAMVFPFLLKTVTREVFRTSWHIPLSGFVVILLAQLAAIIIAPFFCPKKNRKVFIFLAGSPNWIFLPLPIVEGLFGNDGVRTLLLYSVGAQIALWTVGLYILNGAKPSLKTLKTLINPGFIAIVVGLAIAGLFPAVHNVLMAEEISRNPLNLLFVSAVQATEMLGSLTIPLALLVIGSRIGGFKFSDRPPMLEYAGIIIARLIVGPILFMLALLVTKQLGLNIPPMTITIGYLISCMPVAVTAIVFVENFGGGSLMGAKVIFDSTLYSILTVPVFYYIATLLGLT